MSPDTLSKIEFYLQLKLMTTHKNLLSKLLKFLSCYKVEEIIYPGKMIRKLNVNMKESYEILELLVEINVIERNYEVYCSCCDKNTGASYSKLAEIDVGSVCPECDKEIDPMVDTIMVYRVIE